MEIKRILRCGLVLFVLFLLVNETVFAQVKMVFVAPDDINSSIETVHSPNIALYDSSAFSRHQLILMIQGTGGSATDMRIMDSIFAGWGYHVVSIDYKNNVISTICEHSKNKRCSYQFRKEIITGKPLSPKTEVDSVNSILNRFTTFINYLAHHDASGHWGQFLKGEKMLWNKVIVAGHSQGAGHAAMLGKMFKLHRALIFSGPQDYLIDLKMPSPWLSRKSATPENRFYAFLHKEDPFNVNYQIANCSELMQHVPHDTLMVHAGKPIKGKSHILVANIDTQHPHGSTLSPVFINVWKYMLGIQ